MWNEQLKLTENPTIEFGTIDASVSFETFDVPDECFDSLSEYVAEILFSESEETFQRLLSDLGQCLATMTMEAVFDPLGIYMPFEKTIKIDENKIHRCVREMQKRGASLSFSDLSEIVGIHEDKHALHHLAGDSRNNGEIWINFGDYPSFIIEMLAQLFTFHEVNGDRTKEIAFFELERHQSIVYHLWRLFRQCDKERLYWCIRDSYNFLDRIIRILQKIGLHSISYYQVAAGSLGRDYSDLFLKFGMAFVGWGKDYSLMEKIKPGDRLILKQGTQNIKAVGMVVCRYGKCCGNHFKDSDEGKNEFKDRGKNWLDDFDGWDLPHYCFVNWHGLQGGQPFAPNGQLTRSTFQNVNQLALQKQADQIIQQYPAIPHQPEPEPTLRLSDEEILKFLVSEGLRPSSSKDLLAEFERIRLLATFYRENCKWDEISEEETKTFLVIPLLITLGWSEQQIKMEYSCPGGRIDVALFNVPYHKTSNQAHVSLTANDHCSVIIEVKKFDQGLDYASTSAMTVASTFPNCQAVIASNGWCYKLYLRNEVKVGFPSEPSAYLNILCPTEEYPLDHTVAGAKEVFRHLLRR